MKAIILNFILILTTMATPNLDGRWQAQYAEMSGNQFPDAVAKSILLVLKDGTYEVQNDRGTVRYLEGNKMEITGVDGPNKGKAFKAIYELKGDQLNICYDLSGSSFPSSFATAKDTQLFLVKYTTAK